MHLEPASAENDLPASIRAILAHKGKRRSLLRDESARNVLRNGTVGIELAINLTSYRSLPLSCIEGFILKIADENVDVSGARLLLNGNEYSFSDLPMLSHVWWFILDPAGVFIPRTQPLSSGSHLFDATLMTVEPYITAGRFSFYHGDRRNLVVAEEDGRRL